jgi:type I restriction enzyme, S subunit
MSLKQSTLGDLIELENGYAFKSEEYADKGHFLMRIANVQQGCISMQLPKFVSIPLHSNLIQFELNEGDMLMSLTGNVGRVGLIEAHHLPAALNQRVAKIRIKDLSKVDKGYLFSFFNTDDTRSRIENLANGAAQLNVSTKDIKSLTIPLPSLVEQKRIAAILDKAGEIKTKREQAIAKLDELAQSTFVEMFGDIKNNVHSFAKKPLGDLIKLSSGDFLPASNMQENGKYAVYGGNGINGYHDAYMFEERCIVIGRVGAYCGCVHITNEKAWITDNALYVDMKDKDLDFDYLAYALMMANLNSVSSKSGQPLVSGSRIYPVEILQPPLPLQKKFAKAKAKIDALKSDELRGMDYVIKLTASLQHQAFTIGFAA